MKILSERRFSGEFIFGCVCASVKLDGGGKAFAEAIRKFGRSFVFIIFFRFCRLLHRSRLAGHDDRGNGFD